MKWLTNMMFELRSLATHENTRMTIFIAAFGYAILYPLPYQNQLPTNVSIAIIDYDQSVASRKLMRMIDATAQVEVTATLNTETEARALVEAQEIRGYIIIPYDLNKNLHRLESSTIAMAGDGAYYLLYATLAEGVMGAVSAFNEQVSELVQLRASPSEVNSSSLPFDLSMMNAFNPELGYRNYVIPGVFLLILHQLALMGMATMTWVQRQRGEHHRRYRNNWCHESTARLSAFSLVFMLLSCAYFYLLLPLYHVPVAPFSLGVIAYLLLFFIATLMVGQLLGRLISHPQIVVVLVISSSLPLVFSAGFIWPVESIPALWHKLMSVLPATTGISYFLQIHIYGLSIASTSTELMLLVLITAGAALLDYGLSRRRLASNSLRGKRMP